MAPQLNCLGDGVLRGKIGGILVEWKQDAEKELPKHAEDQGVDVSLLKAVSEHYIYLQALQMGCRRATVVGPPHEFTPCRINSQAGPVPDKCHVFGRVASSRLGVRQIRVYLQCKKKGAERYEDLETIGVSAMLKLGTGKSQDLDYSWGVGTSSWAGPTFRGSQAPRLSGGTPTSYTNPSVGHFNPNPSAHRGYTTQTAGYPTTRFPVTNQHPSNTATPYSVSPMTDFAVQTNAYSAQASDNRVWDVQAERWKRYNNATSEWEWA
ncbi:hypothetical protein HD806DRAFT_549799 [Xylariaceae sp. AK1471]|nr:hypothetical protein HD806DRAFT_549799 [Xylariaceae sp. AK1471]